MPRLLLALATVSIVAVALALAPPVDACPPTAFSLGYCAAPVQAAYAAPVVSYAQPVVAPLQEYAPATSASIVVLPGRVTYTQPQVTFQLSQAVGYGYAQPVQQLNGYGVQRFSAGYSTAPVVLQSRNSHRAAQSFNAPQKIVVQRQVVGDNAPAAVGVGPLGRVRSVVDGNGNVQQFGIAGGRRR